MSNGYKIRNPYLPHFITITVVDWVDVFTRKIYKDVVIDCLDYCITHKSMALYGYVIMSNHIHLIVQSNDGNLSDLIRDFKKFTATTILEKMQSESESRKEWILERFILANTRHSRNKNYQFWKYGNHPEEIFSQEFMWTKLDYIHLNPIRAGVVKKASHYVYSSANNYVNNTGLLTIKKADFSINDELKIKNFRKYY